MNRIASLVALAAMTVATALPVMAQQKRASPHETINTRIDRKLVSITYGRPYTKDPSTGEPRKIWGGLVPNGKAWRLGADEATLLLSQSDLVIGGATIPAGAHTLYLAVASDGSAKLAVSTAIGNWGIPVDEKHDLVRADAKMDMLDTPVDQFTMAITRNPEGGGIIKMSWEKMSFSVPFTIASAAK
jgi:hypothetical protein